MRLLQAFARFATACLLAGLLFAGCASTPTTDWSSRIGVWTYDQAVAQLGAPTKYTKQSDGRIAAEWVKGSGPAVPELGGSIGLARGYSGATLGTGIGARPGKNVLRLNFDPDGKLENWTQNY
ncbi:MAG: hypothetical protein EPO07_14800 [Verrucomicrobia bacterium]|nr:MAG: hypothetical protein EPO07_14800 [Verrucomicrobiota bacterium]